MTLNLTRFTPSSPAQDRLNQIFGRTFGDIFAPYVENEGIASRGWLPPVDIRETDQEVILVAEIPGLTKEDINITLENSVLTLAGERKFAKETQDETLHRMERSYGAFSRSFTLPSNVSADKVQATFKDGLLTVQLPKREEAKPKRIAIS